MTTLSTNGGNATLSLPGSTAAHWLIRASLAGTFLFHGITKFPYLAAGAGAVSYLDGVRGQRVTAPEEYCQRIEEGVEVVIEGEQLDREASFRETVMMGLRLTAGVSRQELVSRFGLDPADYYGEVLDRLQQHGLVELNASHLRVTEQGRLFSNIILAELV